LVIKNKSKYKYIILILDFIIFIFFLLIYHHHQNHKGMFGISPQEIHFIYLKICDLMENNIPKDRPVHLLWTLFFMRLYLTEDLNSLVWNTSRSTFRIHVTSVIKSIEQRLTIYVSNIKIFQNKKKYSGNENSIICCY
jgi:hypothetical protein